MFRIFIMNMIGFLNENGPAVTAIAATMTVILTYFYLRHINKQRHEMVRPKIWLYELHTGLSTAEEDPVTYLTFWNIGLGHAYNVHFEYLFSTNVILKKLSFDYLKYLFWFRFDNEKTKYSVRLFSRDKPKFVETELSSAELTRRKYACVQIKVVYVDELGTKHTTKQFYNFCNSSLEILTV